MLWKEINWLHKNLPYPFLKLWGSSERLVSLSRKLALGVDKHKYMEWHRLLKDMEKWSLDKIYEFQYEKLRKILEHAYKNVPYYKEMFNRENLKPSDIRCLEDLQKLPVITKDDVMPNYKRFFARNLRYKRKIYRVTSGTSGRPAKFYLDENVITAMLGDYYYLCNMLGYSPGRDVVLRAPITNQIIFLLSRGRLSFGHYSPVIKQVLFPSSFIGDAAFRKYVEYIKKFKIKHIDGSPSILFAFAKYIKNNNKLIKIKTAIATSEVLFDFQRKFIEKHLGCEVFRKFGSAESSILAFECDKHEGMHISPRGIAEVRDQGLKGKGELVMTNILNHTFPIIRYTTQDIVTLTQKKCTCGRPLPRLLNVEGRSNDFIFLPNGGYLHPSQLGWFTVIVPGIKDIFFLQHKDFSLDILVVKEEKEDTNKIINDIKRRIKYISKNKLKFRIIFKEYIERKSHKFKVVETKVTAYQDFLSIKQ